MSDTWNGEGGPLASCAIITTRANELVKPLHERMPVILPESAWDAWLEPANADVEGLQALLKPGEPGLLTLRRVSPG